MFRAPVLLGGRAQFVLAAAGLFISSQASAFTLDDIEVWVGTGDNQAGLVIDWFDGGAPAVYGYRFDGSANGEQMLRDIANARSELYLKTGSFSSTFGDQVFTGRAVFGLGLDRDNDGFAISDGSIFTNGINETDTSNADGATPTDSEDSYQEGWNSSYWAYWSSDGTTDWGFAPVGFTDFQLSDGDLNGWSYQSSFTAASQPPSIVIPEPGAGLLLAGLSLTLIRRRRASHRPAG